MFSFIYSVIYTAGLLINLVVISCEFSPGHVPDEYPKALINLSYIDPKMARVHDQNGIPGKYASGKVYTVNGIVVPVRHKNLSNHSACSSVYSSQDNFIIFVRGRKCGESALMICAAEANASAVVVYPEPHGRNSSKKIHRVFQLPCVYIKKEKGEEVETFIERGGHVQMNIDIERQRKFQYPNINHTSVLFFSVAILFSVLCTVTILLFCYVKKYRSYMQKDKATRIVCAAQKALEKLPARVFRENAFVGNDYDCCAVCIESIRHDDVIRELPCKHIFHKSCIDPWILMRRCCPMCKLNVLEHFGIVFTGSQESMMDFDDPFDSRDSSLSPRIPRRHPIVPVHMLRRPSPALIQVPITRHFSEPAVIDMDVLSLFNLNNSLKNARRNTQHEETVLVHPPKIEVVGQPSTSKGQQTERIYINLIELSQEMKMNKKDAKTQCPSP